MINNEWSLIKQPPEGHKDVGEFFWRLYEAALAEQERLKVRDRVKENHALYRGMREYTERQSWTQTPVNLFFSNVERTVANVTARHPTAEVVDLDGVKDKAEEVLTARMKMWHKETKQRWKHRDSSRNMEISGCTPEKPYWDTERHLPDISVLDLFRAIPAPGVWHDWATDAPYLCFLYSDATTSVEEKYGVKGLESEDTFDIMGKSREEDPATKVKASSKLKYGRYEDRMTPVSGEKTPDSDLFKETLVIEVWIRGATGTRKEVAPQLDDDGQIMIDENTGEVLYREDKYEKYPDGIRKVTIARGDKTIAKADGRRNVVVLDDSPNPNINPKLEIELAKTTYPWGKIPAYKADSYRDSTSSYGFSVAEQVGDLLFKIENIITRLFAYASQALSPTLIIERYCGITREMIEAQKGKQRLVIMPTKPNADIRYLPPPNLPATFFRVLDLLIGFFDRIYQIEDADRGVGPKGVVAASAIVALQERNAVLMQAKIDSADYLTTERGKWAIGLWQNFGTKTELIEVNGEQAQFQGVAYRGRRLNYAVEAGSTMPKTSMQVEEQVKWLANQKLIDLRTILEALNFPNWKTIVERNGENQLDMALNVLIEAGLQDDEAKALKQMLMQPQGGPGDTQEGDRPVPGTPRAAQGANTVMAHGAGV